MSKQLTKKQHYIPTCYLKSWAISPGQDTVYSYDLAKDGKIVKRNPKNILKSQYYYEVDPSNPDNETENFLGEIENKVASIIQEINKIMSYNTGSYDSNKLERKLKGFSNNGVQNVINDFACSLYFRHPGAIKQKEYEVSQLEIEDKSEQLKPGKFTINGYMHMRERFVNMTMIVHYSFDEYFLTSDWPFFDLKDSDESPHLGEDFGSDPDVVGLFALTPRINIAYYHKEKLTDSSIAPSIMIQNSKKTVKEDISYVRNCNELCIQQAERYIISNNNQENLVSKVLAIRKKRKPIN